MFHPASPGSVGAFLLIGGGVLTAFLCAVWTSARRDGQNPVRRTAIAASIAIVWLGAAAVVVASGWVEARPTHLIIFGATMMLGSILIAFSRLGAWVITGSSIAWLLAFQGFRLPLELVLHSWASQGVIPSTMTWTGSNWDILSGIVALVLAPLSRRFLTPAWIGNLFGALLLLNVGRVAVLSAAVPFGWQNVMPKLQLPYHLPYALIIPVCVGGALIGHIALTRALLRPRN